ARIWDHARTDAQIFENYSTRLTGNEAGLDGYYPMILNSGDEFIKDYTANNRNADLINTTYVSSYVDVSHYHLFLPDNFSQGDTIGKLMTYAGDAAPLEYNILSSTVNGAFAVNQNTGSLYLLNAEVINYHLDTVIT